MNLTRRRNSQKGFSLIELLIVIAIILIIVAIAVPKFQSAQEGARELAAIREIQTIQQGQTQYYSQFGRFATNLAELGPPSSGASGPSGADLIPASLAGGSPSSGYVYELKSTPTGYTINASPKIFNTTGRRTFYSDQSMSIRQNWGAEPATVLSAEINAGQPANGGGTPATGAAPAAGDAKK